MGMTIPAEKAKTLAEASQACDVQELAGETLDRYYVKLAGRKDAITLISTTLRTRKPGQFPKFLFTGHVGSGKSSELAKLAQDWQQQYQIVFIDVEADARVTDVEYTDLFLLVIKRTEEVLRSEGLSFDPILQKEFEDWFKDIVLEKEKSLESNVGLSTEASVEAQIPLLAKLLFKSTAQIKGGAKETTKTRESLRKDFGQLKTLTNALLKDGAEQFKKKFPNKQDLLVIFDGLDKCSKEISSRLFFDYALQLQELLCITIYTIPIGALYTPKAIGKSFGSPIVVPMINIYSYKGGNHPDQDFDPDSDFDRAGLDAMASLVKQRIEIDEVFESENQLNDLCIASGGHLRFLMQMVRVACLIAEGREHSKVQNEDTTYSVKQLQFQFEREIPHSYYETLAKIAETKQQVDDQISPEALYITAVLEYNGENRWIYPNPVVRRSTLFQEALEDARNNPQS
jgi:hypothetical protein